MKTTLLCLLLATNALAQRPPEPDFDVSARERDALVAGVFDHLRTKYVFPERVEPAVKELTRRWSTAEFKKLNRGSALLAKVNADLTDLFHDGHLSVMPAARLPPTFFGDPDAPLDPKQAQEQDRFERRIHYGVQRAEVLPGNIGYLKVLGFSSPSEGTKQAYADALAFLRDTEALIVDVRDNGGGDGESVAELVGYFLEKKTLLQEEYFRNTGKTQGHYSAENVRGPKYGTARDLFVLTSKRSFSAAEEFAYDLQTQKRALTVGESTRGGANHNRFERIGERFAMSVPYGSVKNAVTGKNWEGTGVQPDVAVPAERALLKAQELALEKLIAKEQEPDRKQRLQHRLADVKSGVEGLPVPGRPAPAAPAGG